MPDAAEQGLDNFGAFWIEGNPFPSITLKHQLAPVLKRVGEKKG